MMGVTFWTQSWSVHSIRMLVRPVWASRLLALS